MDTLNISIFLVENVLEKTKKRSLLTTEILRQIKKVDFDRLQLSKHSTMIQRFSQDIKLKVGDDSLIPIYWENKSRVYTMEAIDSLIQIKLGDDSFFENLKTSCVQAIAHYLTAEIAKSKRSELSREELRLKLFGVSGSGAKNNFIRHAQKEQDKILRRFNIGEKNEDQSTPRDRKRAGVFGHTGHDE